VCAMGACLLSYARVYDNVPLSKIGFHDNLSGTWIFGPARENIVELLRNAFDFDQLALIEAAFEGGMIVRKDRLSEGGRRLSDKAEDFRRDVKQGKYQTHSKATLAAIMKNIIANNGIFIP